MDFKIGDNLTYTEYGYTLFGNKFQLKQISGSVVDILPKNTFIQKELVIKYYHLYNDEAYEYSENIDNYCKADTCDRLVIFKDNKYTVIRVNEASIEAHNQVFTVSNTPNTNYTQQLNDLVNNRPF